MSDIISSVASAITLATRLKSISDNIKDAEFKNLLADLSLELADVKLKLVDVLEENAKLKKKIYSLENFDGEPCPKCRKRGWHIEDSFPDPIFRDVGGQRRIYRCSFCEFSEEKLVTT